MTKESLKAASGLTLTTALGLTLAGCEVGPNYKRPTTTMPVAYSATQPAATEPSTQPDVPVDLTRWWESFNDAQLNTLINQAVVNNFDVRIAEARVIEARAQFDAAFGGLFPTLDATGGYTRSKSSRNSLSSVAAAGGSGGSSGSGTGTGTGTGGSGTGTSSLSSFSTKATSLWQGGFDATWELDVFGGQRRQLESSLATLESQIDARRGALITLLSEVARNYVLLRGYQYQLSIVDQNIKAQNDTLQVQQQKLAAGIATDLTVAQAEALLASTKAQRPPLQANIDQTIHRLGILLGEEPTALTEQLQAEKPLPVGPPVIPTDLPSMLLRRRPDIRQAERNLAAATASIGVATAEFFPKFNLTGKVGWSSNKFANLGDSNSLFWSVGPGVSWRLFDAGAIAANVRFNQAAADLALLQYRQAVYQALSDVEDAITAYTHERDRMVTLQASVDANRRAVDLSRNLNTAGVVDFLNVLTAEQSLFDAQNQLAISEQTVSTDLVAVYKALGGGWETTEIPTPRSADDYHKSIEASAKRS